MESHIDILLKRWRLEFIALALWPRWCFDQCDLLGVKVVLRGLSYLSHGLSHAIFGGAVVTYFKQWNFYIGTGLEGIAVAVIISRAVRRTKINAGAAIRVITRPVLLLWRRIVAIVISISILMQLCLATRSSFRNAMFGSLRESPCLSPL